MSNKEIHIDTVKAVYFIGIGGIGMSAIARYFVEIGKLVSGYDKTESPITSMLQENGVTIHFEDSVECISSSFLDKDKTLVVYTPALNSLHKELNFFKNNGFTVMKRAEVLGVITRGTFCFGVAGTHGKTTTSSILGHIMQSENATSFLGGITENYQSNLILGGDKVSVVEADEFDRSFLQLSPNIACVTSMDADHLDIYGDHNALLDSFNAFVAKVSDKVIVAKGVDIDGVTYAIDEDADYIASNLRVVDGTYVFDVKTPASTMLNVIFCLPGRHNIMNALAAIAMADSYGISLDVIQDRLESFKGVKRRFTYKIRTDKKVLIDDYAHHPTEIKSVHDSVREMYPNEKVLAVFQPHLFSRTKDFSDDFVKELSNFDELLLLDIYPARESPIQGVTSGWLLGNISAKVKKLSTKEDVVSDVLSSEAKVILMIGAGDIGLLVDEVYNELVKIS